MAKTKVDFILPKDVAGEATSGILLGEFNDWDFNNGVPLKKQKDGSLKTTLSLEAGGVFAVITFHSLEDRIVKRFIRRQEQGRPVPRGLPIQENDLGKTMKKMSKAIKPKANEIGGNVRARSAVLRIAERIEGERD